MSPFPQPGAALVVLHGSSQYVFVDGARFLEVGRLARVTSARVRESFGRAAPGCPASATSSYLPPGDALLRRGYLREIVVQVLTAPHRKSHRHRNRRRLRILHLDVHNLIPVFRPLHNFRRIRRHHVRFQNLLVLIALRIRQPDLHILGSRRNVVALPPYT